MHLEILRTESGLAVHYADSSLAIASRGPEILIATPSDYRWRTHLVLPGGFGLERRGIDPIDRLTRRGVQLVKHVEGDTFVALYNGHLYRFNMHSPKTRYLWALARGRRVLRNGACVIGSDVLIGDYWQNKERSDVRVHRIDLNSGSARAFLTFPASKIRHVHLIQLDPFTDHLWIGTGDRDQECLLLQVDPSDPRLQTVGGGTQDWRTISLVFSQESILWGSDNPEGSNAIYRYDRASGNLDELGSVIGPVYYAATYGPTTVFGTTVEKGEGEQDGLGRLYALSADGVLSQIHAERKDAWPARLFGYGVYEFADGPGGRDGFWVTLRGFRGGLRSRLCRLTD